MAAFDPGVVVVFQLDGLAPGEELGGDELLVPGQGFLGGVPADQGVIAAVFLDQHRPFHRHVHHRGGKGLVVIPHAADEAHRPRAKNRRAG